MCLDVLKNRLKELRETRNLTKSQVADGVGINARAYISYEYGERDVSTDVLCRLADFYGVSTDYLLERESNPNGIEILVKEFGLSELEKLFMQTYLESEPKFRESFVIFAEKIVANKEKRTKENSQT
jgi:transcriptional regulator with XRE-family HTH domain